MRFNSLTDWLAWQETLHPQRIDLRLERVSAVWRRLGVGPPCCPVITVGGTNGKGSCVATLDAVYRAAGYRTCAYSSPHLLRYNERLRIDGSEASDEAICDAFARIDRARGDQSLTYFEFGTLAALTLFVESAPDVIILEVGLGGRLDAVNIIDADVSVVTSIGLDHTAWLGDTLDQIAFEKAGIFRAGRPAVIGQIDAPPRLRARAIELGAEPIQAGREYRWDLDSGQWHWRGTDQGARNSLPPPALRGRIQYANAAAAIAAVQCLADRLPVGTGSLRQGLHRTRLPGRFSVLPGRPTRVLDVAHNAEAAHELARNLAALPCRGRRHAIFGVSADKDVPAIAAALSDWVDAWHLVPAPGARGMTVAALRDALDVGAPGAQSSGWASVDEAIIGTTDRIAESDCLLIFGSFTVVEAALRNPRVGPV
jgi:dihydrofolate synthase/folylpolyglutamate synthase